LSSLALSMEFDKAFSAEKIYTIFAENRCVEVFALQANKSINNALDMFPQLPSIRMDFVESLV